MPSSASATSTARGARAQAPERNLHAHASRLLQPSSNPRGCIASRCHSLMGACVPCIIRVTSFIVHCRGAVRVCVRPWPLWPVCPAVVVVVCDWRLA